MSLNLSYIIQMESVDEWNMLPILLAFSKLASTVCCPADAMTSPKCFMSSFKSSFDKSLLKSPSLSSKAFQSTFPSWARSNNFFRSSLITRNLMSLNDRLPLVAISSNSLHRFSTFEVVLSR